MTAGPRVSILIVNYETSDMVRRCVESLAAQSVTREIIVVDNPSPAGDIANLRHLPVKLVPSQANLGYGMGLNAAAAVATGDLLCVMNPDTAVAPGMLDRWVGELDKMTACGSRVGCLAPRLVNENGGAQRSSYGFANPLNYWLHHSILAGAVKTLRKGVRLPSAEASASRPVDWVMGAAMLIPRDAWNEVGGFSPAYFLYAEDTDLCWRLREAGWQTWFTPHAEVMHTQGEPAAERRDMGMVRLFNGLRIFLHRNYPAWRRLPVEVCVLADMALRLLLFALPAAFNLRAPLYRRRVRGSLQVARIYLGGRPPAWATSG